MKLIYKIAMIGTVLASGIVTASAQNTARRSYDQPNRFWNMQTPSDAYYNSGYGGWNDPSSYRSGNSDTNNLATPGTQEERDIGGAGG